MVDAQTQSYHNVFVCSFYYTPRLHRGALRCNPICTFRVTVPTFHNRQVCSFVCILKCTDILRFATYEVYGVYQTLFIFSVKILGNCHISFMEIKQSALKTWLSRDFRRNSVFSQGHGCTDYDVFFVVLHLYETVIVYLEMPIT